MTALGLCLAALIGLSLGMLGGGGSILTVPVFVYVLGLPAKQAIAMSLPVVGITSLVGAIGHWRAGNVELRRAISFGVVAMLGAFAGARVARLIDGGVQLTLLSIVMIVAAMSMIRSARRAPSTSAATGQASPGLYAAGLGVGLLTGIVGVGGGFLIVPTLVVLGGVDMRRAVGTSLVVIAMNTASGFAGYMSQRVPVNVPLLSAFTAIAIVGILTGTRLGKHVPAARLKQGFAALLVVIGVVMLLGRVAR